MVPLIEWSIAWKRWEPDPAVSLTIITAPRLENNQRFHCQNRDPHRRILNGLKRIVPHVILITVVLRTRRRFPER